MNKEALLYIFTPILLVFIVYLLILTVTWPAVRNRSFIPLYLLILLILFPPAFLIFIVWFYIIHLGFMTSTYYIYDTPLPAPSTATIPRVQSQSERRDQRQERHSQTPR